eukprot:11325053-Ditylum_brightwellii.AAC.1
MTKEFEEATVVMIVKKEIVIVLATRASHIMWRRSTVALALTLTLNLRVAATLPAAAALVLVLCQ